MTPRLVLIFSLSAFAFMTASRAHAQPVGDDFKPTAEIALSNDTLQLRYTDGGRALNLNTSRVSGAFFLSEDRDIVLSGNALFPADLNLGPLSLLFGPQVYAALLKEENDDVLGISVGAEARFDINRTRGIALVGYGYYAPDILTFGSADAITDLGARAELRLAPRLIGFGGMRWFEFDLTDGSGERTLQEELFVGVGWQF